MIIKKNRHATLWWVTGLTIICVTIGTGFYHDLFAKSDETYKGLKIFSDVLELVEENYVDQADPKELIENAIQGMVHSLDPHSSFLPPDALEDLKIDTEGEFIGIGISITIRDNFVTVISPIEGTPAFKAGIKAWDKIIKVDGKPAKDLRETVKKIRGPKGTTVGVTIIREGSPEPIDFKLVRDIIPLESVKSLPLKPGYGYIWLTHFRDNSTEDLEKALEELESGDIPLKGLVLDLRNNPGGLLPQAIKIADLFLEKGNILSIKGRLKKHTKNFKAHSNKDKRNYPVVILINGGSASASEIVAGALQDNKRALILGTTSFGKGSVQSVEMLRDGYGIKLTIARYYTPSGRSIQAKGIEPDIIVKYRPIDMENKDENKRGPLKESDLINHLEEEPTGNKNKNTKTDVKPDSDKSPKTPDAIPGFGKFKLEKLQTDNQVMRALEILIGHELLKNAIKQPPAN